VFEKSLMAWERERADKSIKINVNFFLPSMTRLYHFEESKSKKIMEKNGKCIIIIEL